MSRSLHPLLLSALWHLAFATVGALLFVLPAARRRAAPVDFDVYERPTAAAQPLRAVPLATKEKKVEGRKVFGVTEKALKSASPDAVAVKPGNTVAKPPDREVLRPGDAASLPIPTDEYLVTKMPSLASDFRVPYPPEAKAKGVQGTVLLDLLIDPAGAVRACSVVEGPGFGLNEAAETAAKELRFTPAYVEDRPVAVRIRYAYRFVLER